MSREFHQPSSDEPRRGCGGRGNLLLRRSIRRWEASVRRLSPLDGGGGGAGIQLFFVASWLRANEKYLAQSHEATKKRKKEGRWNPAFAGMTRTWGVLNLAASRYGCVSSPNAGEEGAQAATGATSPGGRKRARTAIEGNGP